MSEFAILLHLATLRPSRLVFSYALDWSLQKSRDHEESAAAELNDGLSDKRETSKTLSGGKLMMTAIRADGNALSTRLKSLSDYMQT